MIIIPGQGGTYRHLRSRVTGLLADSGQRASYHLHCALVQAAFTAGADVEVLEAVNVALPGGKLLVPDVVVVATGCGQ